ncbi:hypothetical protein [Alteromonas sp. KUL49]|uniref:hypothetical protein n=1 Tax=Alteromonas sp. KUL49 TaxID=2480798 RepID=UPI00102F0CEE|nr:hypothetical protein [Alteromonas sp. KUL49]TAP42232.1 hypothetical protein EYS00_00980 [Alteromonas sp. KUL49]GEA09821.1 hypothetical protein KUL49_01960 [Alteromonas sp. KUL49]
MKVKNTVIALLVMGLIGSTQALANDRDERRGGDRRGPPPEAIEACEGKEEGESVTFETRRGDTIEATCQTIEEQFAAVPNDHPRR